MVKGNIKNIVFDIGDVLVYFRYREYMRDLGFSEELVELFSNEMVLTPYWHELDRGTEDEDMAPEYFRNKLPQYKDEVDLFWKDLSTIVEEYTYSKALVCALKDAGYGVYALSNYPDKLSDLHWAHFTFLPDMDGYIISAKEKLVKPEPEIYKLLESRFGLNLSECVFVDDREDNVKTARALGMTGIHFQGLPAFVEELNALGVQISLS